MDPCVNPTFDPFDLLGVSLGASGQEVRKRYYQLACLCHPDRGGTAEQMRTLHNAYQFVSRSVALNTTDTLADLQGAFDAFCVAQTTDPPRFVDIHADCFEQRRFHDTFDTSAAADVDHAFAQGGYEIVPSEYTTAATAATSLPEYPTYDAHPDGPDEIPKFSTDVIEYHEPQPLVFPSSGVRDLAGPPLTNFSYMVGKQLVSDYREAFSEPRRVSDQRQTDGCCADMMDREIALRMYSTSTTPPFNMEA